MRKDLKKAKELVESAVSFVEKVSLDSNIPDKVRDNAADIIEDLETNINKLDNLRGYN